MEASNPKAQRLMAMVQGHLEAGAPDLAYGVGAAGCRQFPDIAPLLELTALAAAQSGQLDASSQLFERAHNLEPDNTRLAYNLATVYQSLNQFSRARKLLERCLKLDPNHGAAHANLGAVLSIFGELDLALTHLDQSSKLGHDSPEVHTNRGNALRDQGFVESALEAYRAALTLAPDFEVAQSNYLLCLNYSATLTQAEVLEAHRSWGAQAVSEQPKPAPRYRSHDKIRIGYVSPDFRRHSCAYYLRGLFTHHNRSRFEVTAYSNVTREDEVTKFFKTRADHWRPITEFNHSHVMEMIAEDEIDILVDLAGHSAHNRLSLFQRPIAPVQVTYLGYPNTTGLETMNYRIGDVITDPTDEQSVEEIIRLPNCFLCYQPDENIPPIALPPHTQRGFVTFGSFNLLAKLTDEVIGCWADILCATPQSRLFLKTKQFASEGARERILSLLASRGIARERIELRSHVASLDEHLSLYGEIDLALDPFPYNGTTTTCEALVMGVPVLSLHGDRHAARVGSSLLSTVGLESTIAKDRDSYINRAIELATHPEQLLQLRDGLRARVLDSPLCDPVEHTKSFEAILESLLAARTR